MDLAPYKSQFIIIIIIIMWLLWKLPSKAQSNLQLTKGEFIIINSIPD